jgi:ketosteroid isomerase-like protein
MVDPKIIEQIRLLASKYDTAFNKNDPTAIATLYTEDVHGFSRKNSRS